MNPLRRAALKKLGMGIAAAPALPVMVADSAAWSLREAAGIGDGVMRTVPGGGVDPWTRVGLPKALWRALDRERDRRREEQRVYSLALMGAVEGDIAGLRSLSPAAKARMQADRARQRRADDEALHRRLWPETDS